MFWFGNILTGAFILFAFTHLVKSVFILPLAQGTLPCDYHVTIFSLYGLVLYIKKSFLIMTSKTVSLVYGDITLFFAVVANTLCFPFPLSFFGLLKRKNAPPHGYKPVRQARLFL